MIPELTITGNGTVAGNIANTLVATAGVSGTLTIDSEVTIKNESKEDTAYGVGLNYVGDQIAGIDIVIKGTIEAASGVTVNGNQETDRVKITLEGATIKGTDSHGMYLAGKAATTVKNSTIEGKLTGIEIRDGELTVDSKSVVGGNAATSSKPNGNGSTVENAGIAASPHAGRTVKVTVGEGATIEGAAKIYAVDTINGDTTEKIEITADEKLVTVKKGTTITLNNKEYPAAGTEEKEETQE